MSIPLAAARWFLEAYREHMNPGAHDKEEQEFLPAARRALGAADWAEIDARLSQPEDPLFGAPSEERFAALRQEARWAANTGTETRGEYTIFYRRELRHQARRFQMIEEYLPSDAASALPLPLLKAMTRGGFR